MKKVIFVKPVWLFLSGDQAFVPERVARWLSSTGYAYPSSQEPPLEETPPPLQRPRVIKKLTTRKKGN